MKAALRVATSLGLVLTGLLAGCGEPEPRYEGRPASYWIERIKSKDTADRWRAAVALGEMTPPVPGAARLLAEATKDPVFTVRYHAVRGLVQLGPAAAPAEAELRACLQDENPHLRKLAQRALDQITKESQQSRADTP